MPAADCTCISQRRRKQQILGSFLLCKRPLRSWGKIQFCQRGHTVQEPLSQPLAHVLPQPCPPGELVLRTSPALPPVDTSGFEKRPCKSELKGQDGGTLEAAGNEYICWNTWQKGLEMSEEWVIRYTELVSSPQLPDWWGLLGDQALNSVVYIPTNRNYFQISFCFILSIPTSPLLMQTIESWL